MRSIPKFCQMVRESNRGARQRMAVDKTLYIQLYSIALEEARHYVRLYTQTWIAGIIFGGAAVAMLRFLAGGPYPTDIILRVAIPLGIFSVLFFNLVLTAYGIKQKQCWQIAKDIGLILTGRRQDSTTSPQSVIEKLTTAPHSALEWVTWTQLYRPRRRLFWALVPIALWVPTCLFLAGCIP